MVDPAAHEEGSACRTCMLHLYSEFWYVADTNFSTNHNYFNDVLTFNPESKEVFSTSGLLVHSVFVLLSHCTVCRHSSNLVVTIYIFRTVNTNGVQPHFKT